MSIDTTQRPSAPPAEPSQRPGPGDRRERRGGRSTVSPDTPVASPIWRTPRTRGGVTDPDVRRRRWRRALGLASLAGFVIALLALSTPPSNLTVTEAPVLTFDGSDRSFGTSTLVRHDDAVEGWIHTTGLGPDETVTLWWVIFNEPDRCTPPACDADDIFSEGDPTAALATDRIAAADVVVGHAAGGVARDGAISLAFALDEGEPVADRQIGTSPGLRSARAAEIHLVVRSHGPVGANLQDQLTTFDGGCTRFLVPPDRPAGRGECGDIQFAVHQPETQTSS